MSKRSMSLAVCAMLAAVMLSGCATTQISSEWKNTEAGKTGPYKKIFLTAITGQDIVRRQFEDAFGASLAAHGAEGMPSYKALPTAGEADKEQLIKAVKEAGADGALVVRMVKTETRTSVSPGYSTGTGYYGGYHSSWSGYYEPPTVYQYEVITLEVKLFDVAAETLVWAVNTETIETGKLQKEINSYAKLICERMAKAGFLQDKAP